MFTYGDAVAKGAFHFTKCTLNGLTWLLWFSFHSPVMPWFCAWKVPTCACGRILQIWILMHFLLHHLMHIYAWCSGQQMHGIAAPRSPTLIGCLLFCSTRWSHRILVFFCSVFFWSLCCLLSNYGEVRSMGVFGWAPAGYSSSWQNTVH
jgi:hypothetical protein